jgi:DNA helicase-2/ATP-dependent DNA helicase PcrA
LRNILNIEKDYPDAKVVLLEQNYRSTGKILEAAAGVISANRQRKPKNLWTENEPGIPPTIIETYTEHEEAQFVINEIENLANRKEARPGDCAVMYRTNAQSRVLEETFIRYGIPYRLVAGTRFYERREVKDIIAYLRFIHNPADGISLLRIINVPQRGIGQRSLDDLARYARDRGLSEYAALQALKDAPGKETEASFNSRSLKALAGFTEMMENLIAQSREMNIVDLFDHIVESSGYRQYISGLVDGEERWENILELRTAAMEYRDLPPDEAMAAFLESVALVSDVDSMEEGSDAPTLITLHQAKGLEFPVVFIIGMEDGILPHFRSIDDPEQLEEERRLCYVGITRAKQRVYLVHAFRRTLMGNSTVNKPSRFLSDIPASQLVRDSRESAASKPVTTRAFSREITPPPGYSGPELKPGDHVIHAQFGEGVVVSCKAAKNDVEVSVAFEGSGIKQLLLSFAKLEKV